jgi:hypothetical protein
MLITADSTTATSTTSQAAAATNGGANANQNGDYPMEAVLTLMQLNAGWRQ